MSVQECDGFSELVVELIWTFRQQSEPEFKVFFYFYQLLVLLYIHSVFLQI